MANTNNTKQKLQIASQQTAAMDSKAIQPGTDGNQTYISMEVKVLNRYMPRIENTGDKMFYYGVDNLLPQEMIRVIGSNGTALRAVRKVGQYIRAKGFADKKANKFKCHPGWTARKLLAVVSSQVSIFRGFTLAIYRDIQTGKITGVEPIEFELCRKKTNGSIVYNRTLGTNTYMKSKGIEYPEFIGADPDPETLRIRFEKYPGKFEILYVYEMDALSWKYPMPEWWASEYDVRAGAELQLYDFETIYKGFLPSVLITWIGRLDNKIPDKDGLTQLNRVENTIKKFTGRLRDEQTGVSGRQSIALWNVDNKEQVPDITPFNVEEVISGSIEKRDSLDRAVCRAFGVHPILLGFADTAALGSTQAIANASNELNKVVEGCKEMIEQVFSEELYPDLNIDWTISVFHQVKYIPDSLMSTISPDEKREMINFQPFDTRKDNDDKRKLAERLLTLPPNILTKVLEGVAPQEVRDVLDIALTEDPNFKKEVDPTKPPAVKK